MRNIFVFPTILLLTLTITLLSPVFAEEFAITKIGALSVDGKYFTHWWYEPTRLTLEGTGSRGANIDIYIDDKVATIKASETDGKWKYSHPTELEKTDHTVNVASGDKKYSFVLTVGAGSVPVDAQEKKGGSLPDAGTVLPVLGAFGIAGMLIYFGFREQKV